MRRKEKILKRKGLAKPKKSVTKKENVEFTNKFILFYHDHYKKLLLIPFIMLFLALASILTMYVQTGDFLNKGISLSGGITITVLGEDINKDALLSALEEEYADHEIIIRLIQDGGVQRGVIVESTILPDDERSDEFTDRVKELTGVSDDNFSVESIGASLGDAFFRQAGVAVLVAFLFMGIVVFAYFRTLIPSLAVILAAASNIIVTVAILNVAGFRIGTAGIAALLMLIGYSVDTDILLTTRLLKEKEGEVFTRLMGAMKTGLTMVLTTILAALVTYFIAESDVLKEILLIVILGLSVDLINTWLQNAGILRWYIEKKGVPDE